MILFYELSSFLTMIKNLVNERSSLKQREASFPPPLFKNNGGKESKTINTNYLRRLDTYSLSRSSRLRVAINLSCHPPILPTNVPMFYHSVKTIIQRVMLEGCRI